MTELMTGGTAVLHAEIVCDRLPAAAAALNGLCDRIEDLRDRTVLALSISSGTSLSTVDVHLLTQWERALRRVERARALSIAAVQGDCHSFALDLLLVADYRIAGVSARLRLQEMPDAILPTMAIHRLAAQIGAGRARRAVLFNEAIEVSEALALGLVDEIAEDPAAALTRAAAALEKLDTGSLAVRRQLLLEAPSRSYEDALGTHLAACDRLLRRTSAS